MRSRFKRALGGLAAVGLAAALVPLTAGPTAAAPGAQPAPTLSPDPVATAIAPFTLSVPGNVYCDGTGGDGWRAHTFIVNDGVDVSALDFTPPGLPAGYVGADFDSVGDGTVAAPLHKGEDAGVNFIPAATPAGLVDPSAFAGFTFDPSFWSLADGQYQIGFVCVDGPGDVQQWWSLKVSVDADASPDPFMTTTTAPVVQGTQLLVCTGTHTVATVNPTLKNGFPQYTAFAIKKAVGVFNLLDTTQSNPINDDTTCTVDAGIRTEQGGQDAKYLLDNQANGHATLTLAKVGGKLVGSATCVQDPPDTAAFEYPNAYPVNGKLVWKWNELDVNGRQLQTQMYVRLGVIDPGDAENDPIVGLRGIVIKGVGVGGDVATALSFVPTSFKKNATALNCGELGTQAGGSGDFGEVAQYYTVAAENPETFAPIPLTVTLP